MQVGVYTPLSHESGAMPPKRLPLVKLEPPIVGMDIDADLFADYGNGFSSLKK
jgi:hypothetical protein